MIQQIQKSIDFVENQLTANAKRALTTNLRIMIKLQSIYIQSMYVHNIHHSYISGFYTLTLCSISTVLTHKFRIQKQHTTFILNAFDKTIMV